MLLHTKTTFNSHFPRCQSENYNSLLLKTHIEHKIALTIILLGAVKLFTCYSCKVKQGLIWKPRSAMWNHKLSHVYRTVKIINNWIHTKTTDDRIHISNCQMQDSLSSWANPLTGMVGNCWFSHSCVRLLLSSILSRSGNCWVATRSFIKEIWSDMSRHALQ